MILAGFRWVPGSGLLPASAIGGVRLPASVIGGVRLQPDLISCVDRARDDDAAGAGDDIPHVGAAIGRARHPRHLARVTAREPLVEKFQLGKTVGGSNAAQIKAKR